MGTVELDAAQKKIKIYSNILIYGSAISQQLATDMNEELNTMWNQPNGTVQIDGIVYNVGFQFNTWLFPNLTANDVATNKNPKNNYFRIEPYCNINISFVDDLGSNTGYFLLANLYKGSTTTAHEYGHTLGLAHPENMDLRGQGAPGIMYARGTLVDPQYQYNIYAKSGDSAEGGTMHPMHRVVKQEDITNLHIENLTFQNQQSVIGKFTNIYHEPHKE
jgi:hypothetical protein